MTSFYVPFYLLVLLCICNGVFYVPGLQASSEDVLDDITMATSPSRSSFSMKEGFLGVNPLDLVPVSPKYALTYSHMHTQLADCCTK